VDESPALFVAVIVLELPGALAVASNA